MAAEILETSYTEEEVMCALSKMGNNKSSGPEAAPSECYKRATYESDGDRPVQLNAVAPVLTALMERIRKLGDYPAQFTESHLTPVYKKKGDACDRTNYRGIAVGGTLAKCYAALNQARLAKFGEETDGSHACQAAFRAGYSTYSALSAPPVCAEAFDA